jgi:hypothetical protein
LPDKEDSAEDEFVLPARSNTREAWAAKGSSPARTTVVGRLGFDDIEGGCAFLETQDGIRYEVSYPAGWALDRVLAELRGPQGLLVRAGQALTVRGTVATDRSSICQIGPIFVATEVEIPSA